MKCWDCEKEINKSMSFCSNCGKSLKPKSKEVAKNEIAFNNADSIVQMNSILNKKRKNNFILLGVATIIFLIALYNYFGQYSLYFIAFGYFMIAVLLLKPPVLNENQYVSLPNSKNNQGQHQCIFCSNKGIWKSTIYKTSVIEHKCSKCHKVLYHQ